MRTKNNRNEKSERNRQIYDEYTNGSLLLVEIADKYGLSVPRVNRICKQEELKVLKEENELLKNRLG